MQKHQIVVPCYNEAQRFDVDAFTSFLEQNDDVRFLFVDDGSTDGTHTCIAVLQDRFPHAVSFLRLDTNVGKGEAVRIGIQSLLSSGATYIGFWDADLSTPLREIRPMADILDADPRVNIVFGSRVKLMGRHIHRKMLRHYLGRVFATVVSIAVHLPVYDTQCGAKLFRMNNTLRDVLREPFITRWLFDVEILTRYIALMGHDALALSLHEHPLMEWSDVRGSKVRFMDFAKGPIDLWRIKQRAATYGDGNA